ncbi:MAG: hypothetical protein V3S25_11990 [Nitrospirales bacterium]
MVVEIQAGGPKERLSQAPWSVGSSTKTQIRNAQGCMDNPKSWHVHGPKMDNLAILAMLCKKPKVAKAFGHDPISRVLECILMFLGQKCVQAKRVKHEILEASLLSVIEFVW